MPNTEPERNRGNIEDHILDAFRPPESLSTTPIEPAEPEEPAPAESGSPIQENQPFPKWLPAALLATLVLSLVLSLAAMIISSRNSRQMASSTIPVSTDEVRLAQLRIQAADLSEALEDKTATLERQLSELKRLTEKLETYLAPTRAPRIQVNGILYLVATEPSAITPSSLDADGLITSIVPKTRVPTADNQANFDCEGKPYIWIDDTLYVQKSGGSWYLCEPQDAPPQFP